MFGSEEKILFEITSEKAKALPAIPVKFATLEQARDYIFTEVEQILHTPDQVWMTKASRDVALDLQVKRIIKWSAAYTEAILHIDRTETDKCIGSLLKLSRSLAHLLLYLVLHMDSSLCQTHKDGEEHQAVYSESALQNDMHQRRAHRSAASYSWRIIPADEQILSNYNRLQIWGDIILNPISRSSYVEHSASFDSAIGQPRDPLPSPESSGKARFVIKNRTIRPRDDCDESCNGPSIYGVAEQISSMEEHAVFEAVQSRFPHHVDLRWVDVTFFAEERRLLLQYGLPGQSGRSMRWVQEWWAF